MLSAKTQLRARPCSTASSALRAAAPVLRVNRARTASLVVRASALDFNVRPYTLRKGDSLDTIAKKRGLTVDQIVALNPEIKDRTAVTDGSTILLPASKLSVRDKEILDGIGTGYRIYPVRDGESLSDIISKRGITVSEMQSLNPGVDLDNLRDHQLLKLPSNKFTVREREMLIGSGIVPHEFFAAAKNPFVIGFGVLLMVCGFVFAWMKFHRDPDFDEEDGKTTA